MMARNEVAGVLIQHLQKQWTATADTDRTLSVLMIGLDHFKRLSGVYGQETVNNCLKSMSGILRNNLRSDSDIAIQYAKDSFCIVLPQTVLENARLVAERLREVVAAMRLSNEEGLPVSDNLTVSCGVASVSAFDENKPETLIRLADNALHLAKVAGRNRTVSMSSQHH